MFSSRLQIFRLFGIPFFLHFSWLLILGLLTWTLMGVFQDILPGLESLHYGIMGLIAALVFFVCIVLHELGHAVVAQITGTPVRGITLFLFGGVAELGGEPPTAGREFAIAIAGPIVSLILAIGFWIAAVLGTIAVLPAPVIVMCDYLAAINLTVLVFNMIPAFPLDGGRVLRSALWGATGDLRRATYWASLGGQAFAWFLIAVGVLQAFAGNLIGGLWMGLIGLFLLNAARSSYQQVVVQEALQDEPVTGFMSTEPIVVPPSLDLRHWVDDYVYPYHRKSFPVVADGHLQGFVTTRDLSKCPREEWSKHTVGELMHRDMRAVSIPPETQALDALRKMERNGTNRLFVIEGDQLVGVVTMRNLMRYLRVKLGIDDMED